MRRFLLPVLLLAIAGAAAALAGLGSGSTTPQAQATRLAALTPIQQRLVSGFARAAMEQRAGLAPNARAQQPAQSLQRSLLTGCPVNRGSNVRVNQNCLNLTDPDLAGRGQAQNETAIAQDPEPAAHRRRPQNDYRRGDGNCYAYVLRRRRPHAGTDSTPPMGFTRGDRFGGVARQYWQAGGDTSVAWDTKGNAYLSCQMFNRGERRVATTRTSRARSTSSARPASAARRGTSRPARSPSSTTRRRPATALLDKQYMTVDDHGQPVPGPHLRDVDAVRRRRHGYIYEAYSRDYGESFSAPKLVSTDSALCSNDARHRRRRRARATRTSSRSRSPGPTARSTSSGTTTTSPACGPARVRRGRRRRRGDPTRRAAGRLDNRAQVLLAKSTDGGNTFSPPVKVADYYDLPDCATYQARQDPGVRLRPGEGRDGQLDLPRRQLPVGAPSTRATRARSS